MDAYYLAINEEEDEVISEQCKTLEQAMEVAEEAVGEHGKAISVCKVVRIVRPGEIIVEKLS